MTLTLRRPPGPSGSAAAPTASNAGATISFIIRRLLGVEGGRRL